MLEHLESSLFASPCAHSYSRRVVRTLLDEIELMHNAPLAAKADFSELVPALIRDALSATQRKMNNLTFTHSSMDLECRSDTSFSPSTFSCKKCLRLADANPVAASFAFD